VVKVSATPVSAATMKTAALRALESWEAVQRANGHLAQGGYRSALGEYLHALPAQRNDPVIHNKLGICYQNLKDAAGARAAYLRALELDPRYARRGTTSPPWSSRRAASARRSRPTRRRSR
jgi:Flp pilus assembly protein TadD